MERHHYTFGLLATLPYCILISVSSVQGQIVPDGTLPTNVNSSDNLQFTITGGSQTGENLFHSFDEFSVPTGGSAWFDNTSTAQNIISRVTGDSISNIDGLLKAQGNANLFLLNPNGIIFGAEAALDLGGSFIASTADSVKFADGTEFSATNPSASSVLTVSVPLGLQFGDSSGRIINRSQARGGNMQEQLNVRGTPAGLRVDADKTLALVGGEVILEGGNLTAPSGRIEVGSVDSNSRVTLSPTNQGLVLGYEEVEAFKDIHLSQGAIIDVTDLSPLPLFNSGDIGSGDIQIQGRQVTLTNGSQISSFTFGSVSAGTIVVTGSESVELTGFSDLLGFSSNINTITGNDGDAGDIKINTRRLIIQNGAGISTSSSSFPIIKGSVSTGRSGNLTVTASESIQISGSSSTVGPSELGVNTQTNGNAGNLEITTGRLILEDGGKLTAATSGAGQGGTITINASDSVAIMGTGIGMEGQINSSALEASSQGTGDAGNLTITTNNLRLRDGGIVSAATSGAGQGGRLTVSASDTVDIIGNGLGENGQVIPSRLEVSSEGTGDAGKLAITTNNLRLRDGGEIRATSTQAGGGNIDITAEDIRLRDGSLISTSVFESVGGGGNITIDSDVFIALEDSDILANAFDGRGGNITIISPVFLADFFSSGQGTAVGRNPGSFEPFRGNDRVDISVEALGSGDTGNLFISSLNLNQDSLSPLSTNFLPPDQVIADSCLTHRNKEQGSFIVTGTGGLPNNPYDPLQGNYSVTQVQGISGDAGQQATAPTVNSQSSTPSFWKPGDPIQEAQGMMVTSDGRVVVGTAPELVAIANADDLICYQAASQEE